MRVHVPTHEVFYHACLIASLCNGFLGASYANPILPRDDTTSMTTSTSVSTSSSLSGPSTLLTTTTVSPLAESTAAAAAPSGTTDDVNDLVTTSISSAASSATVTSSPDTAFPECNSDLVGAYPPFCEPQNGSTKWVGASYYVTWDVTQFTNNTSITIELDYINATGSAPQHAWSSPQTPKNLGYVIMTIDADWLQGQTMNNLSLTLVALDPTVNKVAAKDPGPIIGLTNQPAQHYPPPPHTSINKLGLEVGIPIGLAAFFFILCGLWFGMRKTRKIELGNVMGRRKGYGVGKSRRQRMGKKGGIQLRETAVHPESPEFRDEPLHGVDAPRRFDGHAREESLGSLADSTRRENFEELGRTGNVFRDEIARQQTGR